MGGSQTLGWWPWPSSGVHRWGRRSSACSIAGSRGLRGELPAGAVDLAATGVAYSHRHTLGLEPPDELVLISTAGGRPDRTRRRVHRYQVDVDPAPVAATPQHPGQQIRAERLVVDVSDQDVLDRHSTFGDPGVFPRSVHDFRDV